MHLGKEAACPVKSARNYYTGTTSTGSPYIAFLFRVTRLKDLFERALGTPK
ncbi:MAG: hypothetical protein VW645_06485 [Betaproteobacteria bacterium]